MTTQKYDDESPMEIDAPNDAFAYDDQTTTTTSVDPIDQAIGFSPNKQRELPVNLSQTDLLEEPISNQPINDDDDDERGVSESHGYIDHASYSSDSSNV
ncbi:unnamed protein product, partial [Rotaria sordida]